MCWMDACVQWWGTQRGDAWRERLRSELSCQPRPLLPLMHPPDCRACRSRLCTKLWRPTSPGCEGPRQRLPYCLMPASSGRGSPALHPHKMHPTQPTPSCRPRPICLLPRTNQLLAEPPFLNAPSGLHASLPLSRLRNFATNALCVNFCCRPGKRAPLLSCNWSWRDSIVHITSTWVQDAARFKEQDGCRGHAAHDRRPAAAMCPDAKLQLQRSALLLTGRCNQHNAKVRHRRPKPRAAGQTRNLRGQPAGSGA